MNAGRLQPTHPPPAAYDEAAQFLRARWPHPLQAGLILGSGLGSLADLVDRPVRLPYGAIPHFPVSTALGHAGNLLLGCINDVSVLVMQGRFHLYEGYSAAQTAFPVRVMQRLGLQGLILTNAAGGLNENFAVGDVMIIEDHISLPGLAGINPLRGPNLDDFGKRFPALNRTYAPQLANLAQDAARRMGIRLQRGVYAYVAGPHFETPAEIRMLRQWGADAVGMSTVPEAVAARHGGLPVLAFSTITNMCVDNLATAAQPDALEVTEAAATTVAVYRQLLTTLLPRLVLERTANG